MRNGEHGARTDIAGLGTRIHATISLGEKLDGNTNSQTSKLIETTAKFCVDEWVGMARNSVPNYQTIEGD